jgi:chromosome segregation ATPase
MTIDLKSLTSTVKELGKMAVSLGQQKDTLLEQKDSLTTEVFQKNVHILLVDIASKRIEIDKLKEKIDPIDPKQANVKEKLKDNVEEVLDEIEGELKETQPKNLSDLEKVSNRIESLNKRNQNGRYDQNTYQSQMTNIAKGLRSKLDTIDGEISAKTAGLQLIEDDKMVAQIDAEIAKLEEERENVEDVLNKIDPAIRDRVDPTKVEEAREAKEAAKKKTSDKVSSYVKPIIGTLATLAVSAAGYYFRPKVQAFMGL